MSVSEPLLSNAANRRVMLESTGARTQPIEWILESSVSFTLQSQALMESPLIHVKRGGIHTSPVYARAGLCQQSRLLWTGLQTLCVCALVMKQPFIRHTPL